MKGSDLSQIVRRSWPGLGRTRPPHARVHGLVEVTPGGERPMAVIAQAGKALDWLDKEPELYSDADLIEPAR